MFRNYHDDSEYQTIESVDREVLRGKKLQEEKLKNYAIPTNYDVVDIQYEGLHARSSACYHQVCDKKNRYSNNKIEHKKSKKYGSSKTLFNKSRHSRKCSIRILELSVPTKRHCLETWRNNQNVLPAYRIEKLRKIVMDETPTVNLHDAIFFFKLKGVQRSRPMKIQNKTVNAKQKRHIKVICAKLAYRITQKLLPSTNIKLKTELQRISDVIQYDIKAVSENFNIKPNLKMETEIADKLTLWIANVLEESSFRLLLDDFEELKKHEGPIWDIIDTLINDIIVTHEAEMKDKEEFLTSYDSESTFNETKSEKLYEQKVIKNEGEYICDLIILDMLEHCIGTETEKLEFLNQFVNDILNEVINSNIDSVNLKTVNGLDISIRNFDNIFEDGSQNSTITQFINKYITEKIEEIVDDIGVMGNKRQSNVFNKEEKESVTLFDEKNSKEGKNMNENDELGLTSAEQQEGSISEDSNKKVTMQ